MKKASALAVLGMALSVIALAEPGRDHHRNHRPDVRRPAPHRPPVSHNPGRGDRHGNWGRGGRVVRDSRGHHRYHPGRAYRRPANPYRYGRYRGRWNTYIMVGVDTRYYSQAYMLGTTYLSPGQTNYDLIDVSGCVKMVRLRVEEAPALIERVALHFTDGSDEELYVNGYYSPMSGDTGWRDLQGWGNRCIDSVSVIGEATPNNRSYRQARVEIWGLR